MSERNYTARAERKLGVKKRGHGCGENAGVGVNMTDAGDDCATKTVGRDSISAFFDEAGVAAGVSVALRRWAPDRRRFLRHYLFERVVRVRYDHRSQ